MAGTAISVISISLLALQSQGLASVNTQAAVIGLVQALSSALLMNVAIVGINQLYDIEIDKVGDEGRKCTRLITLLCVQ
jgi:homogentisate phytyltransferase/homogentisate geranylgeranyltransferase